MKKSVPTEVSSSMLLLVFPVIAYLSTRHILLYPASWEEWLIVDYVGRLLVLAYVLTIPSVRKDVTRMFCSPWKDLGSSHRVVLLILMVVFAALYEALVGIAKITVYQHFPDTAAFKYFEIDNRHWLYFDLTIGLLLVAVSEEILFRGCLFRFFGRYFQNAVVVITLSAIVFGLMHWPTGIDNVFATMLTGIFLGAIYAWSKSLVPCVIIHYFNNLMHFWPS